MQFEVTTATGGGWSGAAATSWRTILCHGCFDVLHPGHVAHLQEARALGDELIVSVTADAHVHKGPGRPVFTARQRCEALRALKCVDAVMVNDGPDAVAAIEKVKPAIYVKGIDYVEKDDAALEREIAAVQKVGGSFRTTTSQKWSSTRIVNAERISDEANRYLDRARQEGFLDRIREAFAKADNLSICFVGEHIIDEYRYVKALSRPPKEFILATVETGKPEDFHGGVVAASLQGEWPKATVLGSPDLVKKTRYVDVDFSRKLYEVYSKQRIEVAEPERERFRVRLIEAVRDAAVVVVIDFGHGLMGGIERQCLSPAKFLAVNAQTNAANHGFNCVTKYEKADFICIDELEARLATRMQNDAMEDVELALINRYSGCADVAITQGRRGSLVSGKTIPAFSARGLDTMGAGDAYLAVTAPLIAAGLDAEIAGFVGNVAGALKTEIIGHREHVTRPALMQRIEGLLA